MSILSQKNYQEAYTSTWIEVHCRKPLLTWRISSGKAKASDIHLPMWLYKPEIKNFWSHCKASFGCSQNRALRYTTWTAWWPPCQTWKWKRKPEKSEPNSDCRLIYVSVLSIFTPSNWVRTLNPSPEDWNDVGLHPSMIFKNFLFFNHTNKPIYVQVEFLTFGIYHLFNMSLKGTFFDLNELVCLSKNINRICAKSPRTPPEDQRIK